MKNFVNAWNVVPLGLVLFFGVVLFAFIRSTKGIHAHEDRATVYIENEACQINLTKEDTNITELNDRWIWCLDQHLALNVPGYIPLD